MKSFFRYQLFRLRFALIISGGKRSDWVMRKKIFRSVGENIAFQPRNLPADPELIILHNNISVASSVTFVTHDVFHLVYKNMHKEIKFTRNTGCIEIMDNSIIGTGAIILPDVRIGPNAIVGAGSVVTKDVPEGCIVAGNPAKVIGSYDENLEKRINMEKNQQIKDDVEYVWERFYQTHDNK